MLGGLGRLKRESIAQAGQTLAGRLLGDQMIAGEPAADCFKRCYKLRSQILHNGSPDEPVDMRAMAGEAEELVASLLVASLAGS